MELDRISLNFHGAEEVALARRLREIAGRHGINRVVKKALTMYLEASALTPPQEPIIVPTMPARGAFDRIARRS